MTRLSRAREPARPEVRPDLPLHARSWQRLASAALPALLIGCSAVPMAPGSARAQDEAASSLGEAPRGTSEESQLMFEILMGELAGRRGRIDVALEGYLAASKRTDDIRVADRAARLAIFSRAWPQAEAAIERWLELEPDSAEARELYAQVLIRQRRPVEAAEQFALLVEAAEDRGAALDRLFSLLQADPDAPLAADVTEQLAERFAEIPEAQVGLARLALARGDEARAAAAIAEALAVDPRNAAALLLRARLLAGQDKRDEAITALENAIRVEPDSTRLRLGLAQLLVETGRADEARGALAAISTRIDADTADAGDLWLTIGLLALEAGFADDAERYFAELLSTGEHQDQAHFQLARIRDEAGDSSAAVKLYEAVAPGDLYITSQVRAAELRARAGDVETARSRLRELGENLPDPAMKPRLLTAEGRILQEAGELAAALEVLSAGLEEFPDDGELLYARALAAETAGQPEMLVADLGRLIASEPENAHALNALGYHFVDRNIRLDEAATYLEDADRLRPGDPAIMDSLGWLRYRQGRNEEAIALLEKALALYPDAEIAAHLGEVLAKEGRTEEARDVVDAALEKAPEDEKLKRVKASIAK